MPKAKTMMYYTELADHLQNLGYREGNAHYAAAARAIRELVQLRQGDRAEILRLRRLIESEVENRA